MYVSTLLESSLCLAITAPHRVLLMKSWAELSMCLQDTHVDLIVTDPNIEVPPATNVVAKLIESFPSTAVVVYTMLQPDTVRIVHELAKLGLYRTLLFGYDDDPQRVALLLDEIPPRQLLSLMVNALQTALLRLPTKLHTRIEHIFESPNAIRSVDEFAQYAGVSRTRLYELIDEVGLGSPKRLLAGAKLLRAYTYLRDPGHAFTHVAEKAGYPDVRALREYLTDIFGMPVAKLRQCDDHPLLVERLVFWMQTGETKISVQEKSDV